MKKEIQGRSCLIEINSEFKKAKVIKIFVEVGGECHGEEFATIILEDPSVPFWDNEITCELKNIKLID